MNFEELTNKVLKLQDKALVKLLLYGDDKYDRETNIQILNCSIKFILESKRFDEPLL